MPHTNSGDQKYQKITLGQRPLCNQTNSMNGWLRDAWHAHVGCGQLPAALILAGYCNCDTAHPLWPMDLRARAMSNTPALHADTICVDTLQSQLLATENVGHSIFPISEKLACKCHSSRRICRALLNRYESSGHTMWRRMSAAKRGLAVEGGTKRSTDLATGSLVIVNTPQK